MHYPLLIFLTLTTPLLAMESSLKKHKTNNPKTYSIDYAKSLQLTAEDLQTIESLPELPVCFIRDRKPLCAYTGIELTLSNCALAHLPQGFSRLVNLTTLSLNFNELKEFPPELLTLTLLTKLDLSYNHLTTLPEEIGQLTNLSQLILTSNRIQELPQSLSTIQPFILSLADNDLVVLPQSLTNLQSLGHLDLSNNQLTEDMISPLTQLNLVSLNLSGNRLTRLPKEICSMEYLEDLNIGNNNLTELPDTLAQLPLRVLDAHANNLPQLPNDISGRLSELYVSHNQLTTLPSLYFLEDTEMHTLDLSSNSISILPTSMANLRAHTLNLSNTNLEHYPQPLPQGFQKALNVICSFNKLYELDLSHCNLSSIPAELCTLPKLRVLNLNNNKLTGLPHTLVNLRKLETLSVMNNTWGSVTNKSGAFILYRIIGGTGLLCTAKELYDTLKLTDNPFLTDLMPKLLTIKNHPPKELLKESIQTNVRVVYNLYDKLYDKICTWHSTLKKEQGELLWSMNHDEELQGAPDELQNECYGDYEFEINEEMRNYHDEEVLEQYQQKDPNLLSDETKYLHEKIMNDIEPYRLLGRLKNHLRFILWTLSQVKSGAFTYGNPSYDDDWTVEELTLPTANEIREKVLFLVI